MNFNLLSKLCFLLNERSVLLIVKIKFFNLYIKVLSLLLKEGFIRGFFIDECFSRKNIVVLLKSLNNKRFYKVNYLKQVQSRFNYDLKNFNCILFFRDKNIVFDIERNKKILHKFPLIQIVLK